MKEKEVIRENSFLIASFSFSKKILYLIYIKNTLQEEQSVQKNKMKIMKI